MALRTISAAGGNFNATASWVEGIVPTSADHVVGNTASGNLTINGNYQIQYMDLSAYTATLIFSAATIGAAQLTLGLAGSTTNFGASMSFSYTVASLFGYLNINVNHTLIQNTTSRIPCLNHTGTNTITLSTNLLVNTILSSSATNSPTYNNNTIFVNEYFLKASFLTGLLGTSNITFDGPVIFTGSPRGLNYAGTGFWKIDTNNTLFFQPSRTNLNTYTTNSVNYLYTSTNFQLLQGTISMTASNYPFLTVNDQLNTNTIRIDTQQDFNLFIQANDNILQNFTTLSVNNIKTLVINNVDYNGSISSPTASSFVRIQTTKDINIQNIQFYNALASLSSAGMNSLGTPTELRLGGTYSYNIGNIISIGSNGKILNQDGAYLSGANSATPTLVPFGPTWVQYNIIRSMTASTQAKLNLTSGTASVIMWTNFKDINASGGNTIKTFEAIQIDNSNNVENITSSVVGGGETSYTFVN